MKPCNLFGRLQMSLIDLGKASSLPHIEFGMLGADSRTVHFFRFKPQTASPLKETIPDMDDIMNADKKVSPFV
jgi:hypothetical protein